MGYASPRSTAAGRINHVRFSRKALDTPDRHDIARESGYLAISCEREAERCIHGALRRPGSASFELLRDGGRVSIAITRSACCPHTGSVAGNDVVRTLRRSDLAADLASVLPTGRDGVRVTLIAYADRDEKVRLPIIDDELIIGITTACLRASYAAPGCLCAPIAMTEQPVPIFEMKNVGASAVPMWIR